MNTRNNILSAIVFISIIFLSQAFSQTLENQKSIALNVQPIKINKNSWEFNVNIKNNCETAIYLMTEPTQVNGEEGHYILLNDNNQNLLEISSRVFPRQLISPYSDSTGVKLIKLKPNETFEENIVLKFPLSETSPPIGVFPENLISEIQNKKITDEKLRVLFEKYQQNGKKINSQQIQFIEFSYGYFFEELGIIDFLNHKPQGWYIKGKEKILAGDFNGQSLLEIQNLVTSDSIEIKLDKN